MARVLVCEDDDSLRRAIEAGLRGRHTVAAAGSGADAIRLLTESSYDLLITDILMPEVDGLEVIAHARREAPATKVLAISGGSARLSSGYALRTSHSLGAHHVLEKPFSLAALSAAVEQLLAATPTNSKGSS